MNLLLLLSALLSALTGVGASARAPERAQAVAEASIGRAAQAIAPAHAISRPANVVPALVAAAQPIVLLTTPAPRALPRWIDRRRE
ncbi:hypothetical protein [Sphingomonas rubra]|uniref:Uncharacterized protein n=1 Tax=Sphingomonas rubra TaxID=634430 RepID=A0A1I5RW89_9SPHN|nr:hypothetical protein [Sphingomonas rubra]SFP62842.1 hypothetical protein SAMN04488241_104178 [Sphingomonas rubra]